MQANLSFKLPKSVVAEYSKKPDPFGFNGLGHFVYKRTYSRVKEDGTNETWAETVERVVNGTYTMQRNHVVERGLGWDDEKGQESAREMYDRLFNLKFTPPGRGLWAMGTKIVESKGIFAALNNCFSGETMFETRYGERFLERKFMRFDELVGQEVYVCCADRKVRPATVSSFGMQAVQRVTLKFSKNPKSNSNDVIEDFVVVCTPNHRWLVLTPEGEREFTTELTIGDVVPTTGIHNYTVVAIEPIEGQREVFCVTEPETQTFCLTRSIITGNCAFVSTKQIASEFSKPFRFLMDMSMLGVGCGFDVAGAGTIVVKDLTHEPRTVEMVSGIVSLDTPTRAQIAAEYSERLTELIGITRRKLDALPAESWERNSLNADLKLYSDEAQWLVRMNDRLVQTHVIEDTREGWVASTGVLIDSYLRPNQLPVVFSYAGIRKAGEQLKTFGGLSSGPVPLIDLHISIRRCFDAVIGTPITQRNIVDIMNLIGKCVVAGNVRRCLAAGTLVHTTEGLIEIQDVRVGMEVVTAAGKQRVTNVFAQGVQQCKRIDTNFGSFYATPNHKMAVPSAKGLVAFKPVSELSPNDRIVRSKHIIECTSIEELPELSDLGIDATNVNVKIPGLSVGVAALLGSIMAAFASNNGPLKVRQAAGACSNQTTAHFAEFGIDVNAHDTQYPALDEYMMKLYNSSNGVPECITRGSLSIRRAFISGVTEFLAMNGNSEKQAINSNGVTYACIRIPRELLRSKFHQKYMSLFACSGRNMSNTEYFGEYEVDPVDIMANVEVEFSTAEILSVSSEYFQLDTYDIEVENTHFFAINQGFISHNSSEIALGAADSQEFIDLKNYQKHPERAAYGWCSNNSVFGTIGMNYSDIARRIVDNGEPGVFWLKNAQDYSRMSDDPDYKDSRAVGTNPCAEQTLESYELCCLCEVFPARHDTIEDFLRTLKFAYLYAKTVTLGNSHWVETNRVMMRNRRIGCSLTGIAQFLAAKSIEDLRVWCRRGYDEIQRWDKIYSEWLTVPRSVKTTSIKPSGCVVPSTVVVASDDQLDDRGVEMPIQHLFGDCGVDLEQCFKDGVHNRWFEPSMDVWVKNRHGTMEKVTRLYVNGVAECFEVPLDDGTVITCTADHKFWVKRVGESEAQWVKCVDLQAGDVVVAAP